MTTVIGYTLEKAANKNFIFMYFRDANGFKYKISGYEENISGARDLRNCSGIKEMTLEEYKNLPEKE